MSEKKTIILDKKQIDQKIRRIAWQIYEDNYTESEIVIAGVMRNGFEMARRLEKAITDVAPFKTILGKIELDKENPAGTKVSCSISDSDVSNKVVIVVDDVLNSGRTLMYGLNSFFNVPLKKLRTAVLVDRSHKVFPVKADFVGLSLATTLQEHVQVDFTGEEAAYLL